MKKESVYIIAEAGVNHNGSVKIGCQLIDAAKEARADAVKFQTFRATNLVSKCAQKAAYQKRLTARSESHFEMIQRLELDESAHRRLIAHAKKRGIQFLSSPFDEQSALLLRKLKIDRLKIPSGEVINIPFLQRVATLKMPVILSTGMSTIGEVEEAVNTLLRGGCPSLALLHCVTEYPAPFNEINLRAMDTLATAFGLTVGYSDHSPGIEIALAAVARGARIIEKHFTLDRSMEGPDHQASLEPAELASMVTAIRHIEAALGDGRKVPAPCERKNIAIARKSLVVTAPLKRGDVITRRVLACKRPGTGIAPRDLEKVIGRVVTRHIGPDEVLQWQDVGQ